MPSINGCLVPVQIVCLQSLVTFRPPFCNLNRADGRIVGIPDEGTGVQLGASTLYAIPAHFLHAEGNFQFYDRTSKILFTGDMGASLSRRKSITRPIATKDEFYDQLHTMSGFHKRYMVSNKVCRFWVNMVRTMDVKMLVPQHGRYMVGEAIPAFLDWIENLRAGSICLRKSIIVSPLRHTSITSRGQSLVGVGKLWKNFSPTRHHCGEAPPITIIWSFLPWQKRHKTLHSAHLNSSGTTVKFPIGVRLFSFIDFNFLSLRH